MQRNADLLGIYVHFPYCIQKCRYCDFFSVGMDTLAWGKEPRSDELLRFAEGVESELESRALLFSRFAGVNTVYFGGGTASLLPVELIDRLLRAFQRRYVFTDDCEVTLEGNPENFTPDYLAELARVGVTRVNAGIQTFSPEHLRRVGRFYDPDRYGSILRDLSESPIPTVGADLMYGFPGQTRAEVQADLDRILEWRFEHLSLYSLTPEAGTPFAADIARGVERAPDDRLQAVLFGALRERLADAGFECYEVSNFARPGFECRHNLRYWLYEPYMGLGPGAHGFTGRERYANARHVGRWYDDPAGAPLEAHVPEDDVPLNVLRLAKPFAVELIDEIITQATGRASSVGRSFLEGCARAGQARIESGLFQWKPEGLLHLDMHVLVLSQKLSESLERAREPHSSAVESAAGSPSA